MSNPITQPAGFAAAHGSEFPDKTISLTFEQWGCLLQILRLAECDQKAGRDWNGEPIQEILHAALAAPNVRVSDLPG